MSTCILCLKAASAFSSYIPINSQKWWQGDILGLIEKHFWPVDDTISNAIGICFSCWSQLNEFHIFYQNIEEAHRRIIDISNENVFTNCCGEPEEMLQTLIHSDDKSSLISNIERTVKELNHNNIKIEENFDEYDTMLSESLNKMSDHMPLNPIKRKRGRPRKYHNMHEKPAKTSKGKRGRPRKTAILNATLPQNDIVQQFTYTNELETKPQCAFITTISGVSSLKKKGRGRPRKIINNEEDTKKIKEVSELPEISTTISSSDVVSAKELSQNVKSQNANLSNLKETVKAINKKQKFLSLMKRRKPVQQHKALMRNYIATSVRCMKFFKK